MNDCSNLWAFAEWVLNKKPSVGIRVCLFTSLFFFFFPNLFVISTLISTYHNSIKFCLDDVNFALMM